MSAIAGPGALSDTSSGYGLVSRWLHWLMALLFAWQFTSALLHAFADETPIESFFWSMHYSVGFTLYLLACARGLWGLANARRRPARGGTLLERAATAGHLLMYLLMILVPGLAVMRAVGNGRGFSVYGIQIVAPGGEPNPLLTAPANAAHGLLAGFFLPSSSVIWGWRCYMA